MNKLFNKYMKALDLDQQKNIHKQSDSLNAQIYQPEEASHAIKRVLRDLRPIAQNHFVTLCTLHYTNDVWLQEVLQSQPIETIEQFVGEVIVVLSTWKVVVNNYTTSRDGMLHDVPELGHSFVGKQNTQR